jgi:hypothetical protein
MTESLSANDLADKTSGEVKNWLENVSPEQIKSDSEFNWLGLASVADSNVGNLAGSYILDSQTIIDWFYDNLDFSLDNALEISNKWGRLIQENNFSELEIDKDELIKVRRIKNRLSVIEALKNSKKVSLENEIQKWFIEKNNFI